MCRRACLIAFNSDLEGCMCSVLTPEPELRVNVDRSGRFGVQTRMYELANDVMLLAGI